MGAQHTPGPWKVSSGTTPSDRWIVAPHEPQRGNRANNGAVVADVWKDYGGMEGEASFEANARLIAAAPELLEAAKSALKQLEAIGTPQALTDGAWAGLVDAIAKAEGRP